MIKKYFVHILFDIRIKQFIIIRTLIMNKVGASKY
jgi:hypothetical protein